MAMFDAPVSRDAFAGFVRQLHQRPDVSGNRLPPVAAASTPFFQPAEGSRSLPLGCEPGRQFWPALGYLLWQTLGCTQVRLYPSLAPAKPGLHAVARRPLASGGARYPADLRLLVPPGAGGALAPFAGKILAYAPQYHRLFVVGDCELGMLRDPAAPTLVISLDFLRTWEKYGDFAYRLSAVDSGLVLGRLLALLPAFAQVGVDFDFDAARLDAMLGLDPERQASYCVLQLRLGDEAAGGAAPALSAAATAAPPARSAGRLSRPFLAAHRLAHGAPARAHAWPAPLLGWQAEAAGAAIALAPTARPAGDEAMRQRRSHAHAFTGAALPASAVHNCMAAMQAAVRAALQAADRGYEAPDLLVCCLRVAGIPAGLYAADAGAAVLRPLAAGDFGAAMSQALLLQSFDLRKSAFIVHVCTRRWQAADPRGARAYRIDQMLTGVALDAGTLAVSDGGVSAHAYLGFDAQAVADLYHAGGDVMVGAQLCVGAVATGCELARPVHVGGPA